MKKHFITGLAILLPVAVTVTIVIFVLNFFTEPFVGIVQSAINHYGLLTHNFWILSSYELQYYAAKLFILVILIALTILLGIVTRWFFFHYFIQLAEKIVNRIPLVRTIYRTSQDVTKTIFNRENKSFKQVVFIPFPNSETYGIGFITSETLRTIEGVSEHIAVFVPTTPNPTSGFLLMVKKNSLVYVDMSIEDALKYVVSCGMIAPQSINPIQKPLEGGNCKTAVLQKIDNFGVNSQV